MSRAERRPDRAAVLVTGAGGFIGSHLAADLMQRGHSVRALDIHLERIRHLEEPGRLELVESDVTDRNLHPRALDGIDTVFHLAAMHLEVGESRHAFWRTNVEGVRSLIDSARGARVRRFVHCSTVGVYGRITDPPANEKTACHPELPYEESKLAGERVVQEAIQAHAFPAVILRPAWVYGPGCHRTEKLFRTVQRGAFVVGGRGEKLRHCVYIRDMLQALHLAAVSDRALGQIIIIGDAKAATVRELINEIARLSDSRRPPSVPLFALSGAAGVIEAISRIAGISPFLSRRSLRFFTANTSFDIHQARELLGFEPRFDLAAGLAETYSMLQSDPDRRVPLPRTAAV